MEKYKFYIEDQEVVNPDGWRNFELRLKRDEDISGLLISSTNKFTFKGNGYDAIKIRFDDNYNDKLNTRIEVLENGVYIVKYQGVIILTDVFFNLEKRTAQATIEDASFQGAIQSNKNVKSFLNAGMTKNGEQVDTISIHNIDYFNASGTYLTLANRRAYLLSDALDFLIRFMTDNTVKGLQSAYLSDVNNFDGYLPYITTGEAIRLANSDAPNVSFLECFQFLIKTHDLTFDFVTVTTLGVEEIKMRIEDSAFFFQASNSETFRNLLDLTLNVDSNKIASHLEVGNNTALDSGNCSSTTRFFSFQKEDYALKGKGNVDKLIDLKTDFITDSNVIEFIATNLSDDTYDDDIVIVQAAGTQARRFQSADYCSNNIYYNGNFTNDKIIDRNLNAIPNSITKYLTAATTPAKAVLNSQLILDNQSNGFVGIPNLVNQIEITKYIDPLELDKEIYDLGNNYDPNLPDTFYDVPYAGVFSFEASVYLSMLLTAIYTSSNHGILFDFRIEIRRWNSSFTTVKESVTSPTITVNSLNVAQLKTLRTNVQSTMNCDTGDRVNVLVVLKMRYGTFNVHTVIIRILTNEDLTYFKCLGANEDAGTYKVFDPNSFKARKYKFKKNVSLQKSDNIRANTRSSIVINELSDTTLDKTVWVDEMVNNVETGETSFTMIN